MSNNIDNVNEHSKETSWVRYSIKIILIILAFLLILGEAQYQAELKSYTAIRVASIECKGIRDDDYACFIFDLKPIRPQHYFFGIFW